MTTWSQPAQLVLFEQLLARAERDPSSVTDADLIQQVKTTYWSTNCWSFVEASLAIISATCALRPHLAVALISDPIDAMLAGGLENEADIISQGVALARKADPYVPLSDAGRAWLLTAWPLLEPEVRLIIRRNVQASASS